MRKWTAFALEVIRATEVGPSRDTGLPLLDSSSPLSDPSLRRLVAVLVRLAVHCVANSPSVYVMVVMVLVAPGRSGLAKPKLRALSPSRLGLLLEPNETSMFAHMAEDRGRELAQVCPSSSNERRRIDGGGSTGRMLIRFRRPRPITGEAGSSADELPTLVERHVFPPVVRSNATYSRGILLPDASISHASDGGGLEVTVDVPIDYIEGDPSLPVLGEEGELSFLRCRL